MCGADAMKWSVMTCLALGSTVFGCASGVRAVDQRSYSRSDSEQVPLRTLAVAAVSRAPEAMEGPRLDGLSPYPPLRSDTIVQDGRSPDPRATEALLEATAEALERRGFEVRRLAPEEGATVASLRAQASGTDGLVVVRAVPLTPVEVTEPSAAAVVVAPTGGFGDIGAQVQDLSRTVKLEGRVMLGQAFLFHEPSGVRLWSEHLPGIPADGVLTRDAALLGFGVTGEAAAGLSGVELERAAATAFVNRILDGMPERRDDGRADHFADLDVRAEEEREAVLDRKGLLLDIGGRWSFAGVGQTYPDNAEGALPDLGNGEMAQLGAASGVLRASYLTAGGFTVEAHGLYGRVLGDGLSRSLYVDERVVEQRIEGGDVVGGGLGVGWLLPFGHGVMLHPSAVFFGERWSFDGSPDLAGDRFRYGLEGRLDLRWLPFEGQGWMFRIGGLVSAGLDTEGPGFVGAGGSLGVGAMF